MSIQIDVGGQIFKTTIATIKKINYFKYLLEDTNYDNTQIIFVDRPPHIFKHILSLAIDPSYNYPLKYHSELDFYDMSYDMSKLYNPLENIDSKIKVLDKGIRQLKKDNDHFAKNDVIINDNMKIMYEYINGIDYRIGKLLNDKGYNSTMCDLNRGCYRHKNYCGQHSNKN